MLLIPACDSIVPEGATLALLDSAVEEAVQRDDLADLPDGLHVLLCGAGSPQASETRSGTCVAVQAGEHLYVFDAGTNGARNLSRFFVNPGRIEALFLTHAHSDHVDGLGEMSVLRWVNGGHSEPLPVYGPPVVKEVVAGFNQAYAPDVKYRVAHHADDLTPASGAGMVAHPFALPLDGELNLVLETEDGVRISVYSVSHDPVEQAVGYRVDYRSRSLSISGDTIKSANLIKHSQGVDLLIHEALNPQLINRIADAAEAGGSLRGARLLRDTLSYHTSPIEAAETATEVGADHLLLYHIAPALPVAPLEALFVKGMDEHFAGEITLGEDGTLISLPLEES